MIRIRDLTQSFFTFWRAAQDKEQAEQLRLWQEIYESENRDVLQVYFSPPHWGQRENLPEALKRYEEDNEGILKTAEKMEKLVSKIVSKVLTAFDTREDEVEIDVVIFVGTYGADGFCFPVEERWTTFFALEVLSRYGDAIAALVAHELSHGIHFELGRKTHSMSVGDAIRDPSIFFQVVPLLFIEGLGVSASKQVIPGLEERVYLLYTSEQWDWCQENRGKIISLVLEHLEGQEHQDSSELFGPWEPTEELPYPRIGYYVGYLVIEELLKQYSLRELAEIEYGKYPQIIGMTLQKLS